MTRSKISLGVVVVVLCFAKDLMPRAFGSPTERHFEDDGDNYDLDKNKVIVSFVIFRHGDRTPDVNELIQYPAAGLNDSIFYPFGKGALTNKGKQRAFRLGQYLRERYNDTISQLYIPEEITVRTTNYPRTKMTALSALSAMYPPPHAQKWNEELNWQPIPYDRTEPKEVDDLVHFLSCPRYAELKYDVYEVPEKRDLISQYEPLFELLTAKTGGNISIPERVFFLDNLFQGLENLGLTLPKWVQVVMPKIKEMSKIEYSCIYYTEEMIRLSSGVLMDEIVDIMKSTIAGNEQIKLRLYSAHENNVAAVLAAFKAFDPHQPKYGSSVAVELRQNVDTGKYGVMLVYAKEAGGPGEVIPISGCGGKHICDFDTFLTLIQDTLLPRSEYKAHCALRS